MDHRQTITFENEAALRYLCGNHGKRLKHFERLCATSVHQKGNELTVVADSKESLGFTVSALHKIYDLTIKKGGLGTDDVVRGLKVLKKDPTASLPDIFMDVVFQPKAGRAIAPKSLAQKEYVDTVRKKDVVFAIGPAGTGKTYLGMALAVDALIDKRVKRIVLARPAVEAGERLGFLPGDLVEKVNPYLRPLYDALHDMLDYQRVKRLMEQDVIEVAPLAFMRGRTLNDSFVILDEAQNTTSEQMKMLLTRLGFGSKAVITGDVTQSDLPGRQTSGLSDAMRILPKVKGIGFCYFDHQDVVRHPLVQDIVRAYEGAAKGAD